MPKPSQYLGQAVLYLLFFLPLVYLSSAPSHRHLADDMAVLKVAVRHAGKIIGECEPLGSKQMGQRPANVTLPRLCPRERSPLRLELILDGETLYRASVAAPGLHNDGVSSMYQRFPIPAGAHHLQLRMNDDVSTDEFTWQLEQDVQLAPAQVLVASFKEGFRLQ